MRVPIVPKALTMPHNDKDLMNRSMDRRNYMLGATGLAATAVVSTAFGATALPMPAGGHPSAVATIRREAPSDWFNTVPGERMRIPVGGSDTGDALSVVESIVAPRTSTPLHYHAADEMFLIISGRLRVVCGGIAQDLTAGSSAVIPGGAHHGFVNLSGEPVRMLAIFAPGGMDRMFIQLQATPPEQWGDLTRRFDTVIVGPPVTG